MVRERAIQLLPVGILAILAVALLAVPRGNAGEDKPSQLSPFRDPQHVYVGVKGCQVCHKIKKLGGEEYLVWEKTGHAKAYETLGSDAAKKIASERGIADPQKAPECLKCHTIAFGVDEKWIDKKVTKEEGVSCEACHGPGKDYKDKKIMENKDESLAKGLVLPNETTCRACHNEESPTYKEFKYEERLKKIKHWKDKPEDKTNQ